MMQQQHGCRNSTGADNDDDDFVGTIENAESKKPPSSTSLTPPDDFICPLTLVIMKDPVMDKNGRSFERYAILEWIGRGNSTCPLTRNKLRLSDLVSNHALQVRIQEWKNERKTQLLQLRSPDKNMDHSVTIKQSNVDLLTGNSAVDCSTDDETEYDDYDDDDDEESDEIDTLATTLGLSHIYISAEAVNQFYTTYRTTNRGGEVTDRSSTRRHEQRRVQSSSSSAPADVSSRNDTNRIWPRPSLFWRRSRNHLETNRQR